ncbi:hypothetical protein AB0H17_28620 [Streptomyces olivoreticuli]
MAVDRVPPLTPAHNAITADNPLNITVKNSTSQAIYALPFKKKGWKVADKVSNTALTVAVADQVGIHCAAAASTLEALGNLGKAAKWVVTLAAAETISNFREKVGVPCYKPSDLLDFILSLWTGEKAQAGILGKLEKKNAAAAKAKGIEKEDLNTIEKQVTGVRDWLEGKDLLIPKGETKVVKKASWSSFLQPSTFAEFSELKVFDMVVLSGSRCAKFSSHWGEEWEAEEKGFTGRYGDKKEIKPWLGDLKKCLG